MGELARIGIAIPDDLLEEFDSLNSPDPDAAMVVPARSWRQGSPVPRMRR
jgi:hypothetical protein